MMMAFESSWFRPAVRGAEAHGRATHLRPILIAIQDAEDADMQMSEVKSQRAKAAALLICGICGICIRNLVAMSLIPRYIARKNLFRGTILSLSGFYD